MKKVMSKGFNNTDWLKYINDIETMPSMKDACIRYEKDLVSIISKNRKFKEPPVLMLSGGVDSMMLGTVLKKHFDLKQTFSFASVLDTNDIINSFASLYVICLRCAISFANKPSLFLRLILLLTENI